MRLVRLPANKDYSDFVGCVDGDGYGDAPTVAVVVGLLGEEPDHEWANVLGALAFVVPAGKLLPNSIAQPHRPRGPHRRRGAGRRGRGRRSGGRPQQRRWRSVAKTATHLAPFPSAIATGATPRERLHDGEPTGGRCNERPRTHADLAAAATHVTAANEQATQRARRVAGFRGPRAATPRRPRRGRRHCTSPPRTPTGDAATAGYCSNNLPPLLWAAGVRSPSSAFGACALRSFAARALPRRTDSVPPRFPNSDSSLLTASRGRHRSARSKKHVCFANIL